MAAVIFQKVADTLPTRVEFDRIHRTLGPCSKDLDRPRDLICRLHKYTLKETVLQKAWEYGDLEFDGASIKILLDLSRATLQHRAMLRPVLELARQLNITYRWGFPLSATFHRDHCSFNLRTPNDLPALFWFMETDPFPVQNWLMFLHQMARRAGQGTSWRSTQPRPQRSRRRSRAPSLGGLINMEIWVLKHALRNLE